MSGSKGNHRRVAGFLGTLMWVGISAALQAAPPAHAEWELTFRDEFDGNALDWDVWESESGPRAEMLLESRWPENNTVRDGILYQVTRKEPTPRAGKDWTTAHIWTRHFQQQYGYFEARMRYGKCLNNAFWLFRPMGRRFPDAPHFEIDINEGHTPDQVCMTFHYYYAVERLKTRDRWSTGKSWMASEDLSADFHLYGVEWNHDEIVWYVDGQPRRRLANTWSHAPADVRLSTVIMDKQLQKEGLNPSSMDGVSMAIDWVRVYQKKRDLFAPELPALEPAQLPRLVERPPQVTPVKKTTILLQEDFQSSPIEGLPPGWQIGDKRPAVVLEKRLPHGRSVAPGNHVLRLEPGDYAFRLFDRPISDRLEVEFDAYVPGRESLLVSTLGKFDTNDARLLPNSYYAGDIGAYVHWRPSHLAYYAAPDGWTLFAYRPALGWYRYRLLIDVSKRVFDIYGAQGDKPFVGSGVFRGKQKAACGIALRHHGSADTVYLDNLVVRTVDDK